MSEQQLVTIGTGQLNQIWRQLESDLKALRRPGIPEKIGKAVDLTLAHLAADQTPPQAANLAAAYQNALKISHILDFLRLAANQRIPSVSVRYQDQGAFATWIRNLFPGPFKLEPTQPDLSEQLNQIEQLIQSCYQPFEKFLVTPPNQKKIEIVPPDQIVAVYFQGEYLSRPDPPVPFLIVPNFFEGDRQEQWTGVAHETGHHIYRQVPGLREELEVTVGRMLRNSSVTVNGVSQPIKESQQRLWFNFLEESFADLIGVLTLGAAYVYTGHIMIRCYATDEEKRGIGTRDLTHPIPILRGEMGNYMYERLLLKDTGNPNRAYLNDLQQEWQQVTNGLPDRSLRDPHTPLVEYLKDEWMSMPSGNLDYDESIAVMKLFVDTLLDSQLEALDCQSLGQMYDFAGDEFKRMEARRSILAGGDVRIQVAAKGLSLHTNNL